MDTHENDIPDEDLPGRGILDTDYIREQMRQAEMDGVILWDDADSTYRTSARGIMLAIGAEILSRASIIDPRADQDEIMHAVVSALPWAARATMVTELVDDFPLPDPDAPGFTVPETLPEGWEQ